MQQKREFKLLGYNMQVEYKARRENLFVDALSCRHELQTTHEPHYPVISGPVAFFGN